MAEQVERILFQLEVEDIGVEKSADDLRRRFELLTRATKALDRQAKALQKSLSKEDRTIDDAAKATKRLNDEQRETIKNQKQLSNAIEDTTRARKENIERAREFGDIETGIRPVTGAIGFVGGAGGQQFEQIANIGPELLGAVEGLGLLKEQLPEFIDNLDLSRSGLLSMATNVGLVSVAAAGIAIPLVLWKKQIDDHKASIEANREEIREWAQDITDFNIFLAGATTEDLEKQIETAQTNLAGLRRTEEELNTDLGEARLAANEFALQFVAEASPQILAAFSQEEIFKTGLQKAIDAAGGELELPSGAVLKGVESFDELEKQLEENQTTIVTTTEEIADLNAARTDELVTANDAAEAEDDLAVARRKGIDQIVAETDREAKERVRLQRLASDGTIAQVEREIDRVTDARDAEIEQQRLLGVELAQGNITFKEWLTATADTVVAIGDLNEQLDNLEDNVLPLAAANELTARATETAEEAERLMEEARKDAAAAIIQSASDIAQGLQDSAQELQDFADKTAEIEAKRQLGITQAAEKAALDRVNDTADFYADLAKLDRDFFEERADLLDDISADLNALDDEKLQALKDFNKTEIRSTVDHLKRLEDIRTRAQNSIRSASAKLDALGIFEAQQAAEEELKTENDKFAEEKRRRDQDFREQVQQIAKERAETLRAGQQALRDLQQQHSRERQAAQAAFNEKIRREDQQAALERSQQQQRWALEDQQRQAQFSKEETQTVIHQENLLTITAVGMANVETTFENTMTNLVAAAGAQTITPVGSPAANLPTGDLPAFASANALTDGPQGVTNFRQPSAVSQPSGPGALGGITIPISINGAQQPMQVAAEVRRELDNVFAGMVA
jgi:hypothetical protein